MSKSEVFTLEPTYKNRLERLAYESNIMSTAIRSATERFESMTLISTRDIGSQTEKDTELSVLKKRLRNAEEIILDFSRGKEKTTVVEQPGCSYTSVVEDQITEEELFIMLKLIISEDQTIVKTSNTPHHADFTIIYRRGSRVLGYAIIDVKNYQSTVGVPELIKLEKDIKECEKKYGVPPIWASLVSINGSISDTRTSIAPDYLTVEGTRVHLVHDLKSYHVYERILNLLEVGGLDIESANWRSNHADLTDEIRTLRDTGLFKLENRLPVEDRR